MFRVGDYIYHNPTGEYGIITSYRGDNITIVTDEGQRIMDCTECFASDDIGSCKDIIDRASKALLNEEE